MFIFPLIVALCWGEGVTQRIKLNSQLSLPFPSMRHSFTTRMLLTCIRSKLFHAEETTDDIFAEIARQAIELCTDGVKVAFWYILNEFLIL